MYFVAGSTQYFYCTSGMYQYIKVITVFNALQLEASKDF